MILFFLLCLLDSYLDSLDNLKYLNSIKTVINKYLLLFFYSKVQSSFFLLNLLVYLEWTVEKSK